MTNSDNAPTPIDAVLITRIANGWLVQPAKDPDPTGVYCYGTWQGVLQCLTTLLAPEVSVAQPEKPQPKTLFGGKA